MEYMKEYSLYDIFCAGLVLLPIILIGVVLASGLMILFPHVNAITPAYYNSSLSWDQSSGTEGWHCLDSFSSSQYIVQPVNLAAKNVNRSDVMLVSINNITNPDTDVTRIFRWYFTGTDQTNQDKQYDSNGIYVADGRKLCFYTVKTSSGTGTYYAYVGVNDVLSEGGFPSIVVALVISDTIALFVLLWYTMRGYKHWSGGGGN